MNTTFINFTDFHNLHINTGFEQNSSVMMTMIDCGRRYQHGIKEHGRTQEDMTQMQTTLRPAIRTPEAGYFLFLSYYDYTIVVKSIYGISRIRSPDNVCDRSGRDNRAITGTNGDDTLI